jgi:hypothetical protein
VLTCLIRPFGVVIRVACDAALVPVLEHQLSPWEPRPCAGAPHTILGSDPATGTHVLETEGGHRATALGIEALMVSLQRWIDDEVMRRATHLVPLHAGVVAFGGRAVLLPGASGTGKTTLVTALLESGAAYYSDELAFLDDEGRVHPYPRHLVVRDSQGRGRSVAARGPRPMTASPVGLILGLRYEPEGAWRVDAITQSEATLLLLSNTAHRLSYDGVPAALVQAAASARAYRGARGASREASLEVRRLAGLTGDDA